MEIRLPSEYGLPFYPQVDNALLGFREYFKDGDFDCRYFPRFGWFNEEVPRAEKLLDLGCGYGRETFALAWKLGAIEAVGVDCNRDKIKDARAKSRDILRFRQIVCSHLDRQTQHEQLQIWYETNVPCEIRQGILPEFNSEDISAGISRPSDHFDLVYCCYVLDELVNEGKDWHSAIRNIAALVSPEIGRVVIVGPTKRDSTQDKHSRHFISHDDLQPHFQNAGLKLIKVEEASRLGNQDWPETEPKGYVYMKPGI